MVVESRRGLMLWLLALTTPVLLLTTGCTPSVPAAVRHATAVVVFIDFSGSISGQDRVSFRREIESEILSSLAPGDRLLIAPIHDKTLTDFRPLVDATLPAKPDFNGWLNNVLKFNRQAKEIEAQSVHLKEKISAEVAHVFEKRYVSPQTDIFSSLLIAQKLFYDEPRRKVLVVEQLLGDEERAEDVGLRAHVALLEHVRDLRRNLLLEMDGLGLDLFGLAVEFQHVVEPSVEVWLGRQGGVDERTEVGQGLVVDRGDQESVSGRERREDLALDLPSEGHAVLTRDAPGEVDEDDDGRRVSDRGRHRRRTAGRQEQDRCRQGQEPEHQPASGLNDHPAPRSRRSPRPPATTSVPGTRDSS